MIVGISVVKHTISRLPPLLLALLAVEDNMNYHVVMLLLPRFISISLNPNI